jgi:hypothetical protein
MRKSTLVILLTLLAVGTGYSQELEPRGLTNLPLGTNFLVAGYGYANGNILFDPALPLEETTAQLNTFVGAFVRSINFFGASAKVDAILAYGIGEWNGVYSGIDTATTRSGFADLRIRLSFNFLGAPALKLAEFSTYNPEIISGFSILVIAPTGRYLSDRLIILGSNRWTFKPQWGFSKFINKWILETYISAKFFTSNTDFWRGNELSQKPLLPVKVHSIRRLPHNMWAALSVGYAFGGQVYINNELKDSRVSTIRLGLTYSVPVGKQHSLKLIGFSGIRLEKGADFDSVSLLYQYRWNNS